MFREAGIADGGEAEGQSDQCALDAPGMGKLIC